MLCRALTLIWLTVASFALLLPTHVSCHGNIPPHFATPTHTAPSPATIRVPVFPLHPPQPQPQPQPQPTPSNPTVSLPVFVPVQNIVDRIVTNISITLPAQAQPPAPAPAPTPVLSRPVPVVGPTITIPSTPPQQGHIVSSEPPPSLPSHTLLSQIHSIPELGLFSMYLSLPLFENITQTILNQTTNPIGVNHRITVFGPSNIGVLRFFRHFVGSMYGPKILTEESPNEETLGKCSPADRSRISHMKSWYQQLVNMSDAFNANTRERGGNLQAHHNMLQTFIPQYHDAFNKANFTDEERSFMRANLLYHIANSSIHLYSFPTLSFPHTLMNDTRFVLLNSPSHPSPIVSQRLKLVKREDWLGERPTVELMFGVPGSGYYKSRVYSDPHLHNILASNGILHVIDRIQVVPQNISSTLLNADLVSALSVLNSTGLLPRIDVTPNITVFVPSEEAFAYAYGYDILKHNKTMLEHVIQHHIAAGIHATPDLNTPLLTYNNDTITPHRIGISSYLIEDANIIVPNILFKNGIIHIIDKVLTTPALLGQPPTDAISPHYPSQPFPLIPPFLSRPNRQTPTTTTCGAGESVCHIMNVVTNQTSPYPTCFNPSTHVCVNNSFLCPVTAPYACGVACYNISTHECRTVFADGALHYVLTTRTTPYTAPTPTPTPKPVAPAPTCPPGDQVCNIIDIRHSTTEAKPQCFNPYTHICSNNTFLCPVTHPFVCGYSCYHNTFYTCSYGFFNNSFQWMLKPTPLMIEMQANKTTPTPTPTAAPQQPVHIQPQPIAQPTPRPQPQPTHRPTPHPAPPHPTPTAHPHPQPTPTPTPAPAPHPTPSITCPAGDAVCHVKNPLGPATSTPVPTCYSPHTHVCANSTFLCPVNAPLLCDRHCYNATVFECINHTQLKLRSPHIQPRLSPHVAAHVEPRPLSITKTTVTQLPSTVNLQTTIPTPVTFTQQNEPRTITIELPSGITNTPGVTASRVLAMPAGARIALVGEAQLSTAVEALMNLPPDVRQRLTQTLQSAHVPQH